MTFTIDPWDPSYGTSAEGDALVDGDRNSSVNLEAEVPIAMWKPVRPGPDKRPPLVFVDGVRRVDARVWLPPIDDRPSEPALAASWASGAVVSTGAEATVVSAIVGRGLVTARPKVEPITTDHGTFSIVASRDATPEAMWVGLQNAMNRTEIEVAAKAADESGAELVVVDGPLRGRDHLDGTIGLVKTHHVAYLDGQAARVLAALEPGERTPVFTIAGSWVRYSWYLRLPGPGRSPLSGVVRCEAPGRLPVEEAVAAATLTAATLPRFASEPHKDTRAPQNLYPIAGLERQLRHRLGDARLIYRGLVAAAG